MEVRLWDEVMNVTGLFRHIDTACTSAEETVWACNGPENASA